MPQRRVPVQTLFDYLEGGDSLEEFLKGFPTFSRDLALAALEEARVLLMAHCDAAGSSSPASSRRLPSRITARPR
jgi:hypothetical protein